MRIAVVGAGIGGLAAAVALDRQGLGADVYEQSDRLREVGVGMHLGSNGSRILRRWGLADRLDAVAVRPVALEVRAWSDGRCLHRQEMGERWEREFGAPYYTVHRVDLHRALADLLPAGRLHLDRRVVDISAGKIVFADGSVVAADVVVGADGIHSVVRRAVAGPDTPVFSGTDAVRGLVPAAAVPDLPAETMFLWAGPDARLLCYPVCGGRLLTVVGIRATARSSVESWSAPGDPRDLRDTFAGWAPEVTALVGAADRVHRWSLYDREPLDRWGTDGVTLLGDAAHPMLPHHGQGVSQAIEDAVALAHYLAATPGDPVGAIRRYELLRLPHTRAVQLGSRGGGSMRVGARQGGGLDAVVEDVSWIQRYDVEAALPSRC